MKRITLIQRFSLLCLLALVVFGVVVGWIVTHSLESNMLTRSKQLTASIVSDQVLHEFVAADLTTPKTGSDYEGFSQKVHSLTFGPNVERVKIWNKDGVVVWSDEEQLVGQSFPDNDELNESLSGEIIAEISNLEKDNQRYERSFGRLLEVYVPIRFESGGEIETVFEVYQNLDPLYADISNHKQTIWTSMILGFTLLYMVLFGIVWRASRRIEVQSKEIVQSEVRHRSLIQSAPNGIISIDHNGKVILFNASAERMFGYSAQEVMGQPLEMLVPDNYRAKHRAAVTRFYETGKSTIIGKTIELEGLRRDGQVFPVEISLSAPEEGDLIVTGIIRDISERKATQEMEQQLQLAGRLATIGELAAGVAHELNNPLTAVQGMAQLLTSRKDLDKSLMSDLDTIYNEAQRASKITSNLLSFARRHEPEKRVVSINEALEKSVELHAYRMRVNNIEILTELAPDLPLTMADFHQIQQVFANLITNAEQAMTEAHERGKLIVRTQKVGETIEITFADDGPGIPQENQKTIFKSFFTTKEVGKGTGLGLSICRGIVENHGGRMYARSEPGEGATFVVSIPIVSEDQAAAEETDSALGQTIIQDGIQ